MSTTTITPEAAPAAASAVRHLDALRRSFWYKVKATAAPTFTTITGYIRGLVSGALSLLPGWLSSLIAPVFFVTRWGWNLTASTLGWAARLVGRALVTVASFVHGAINWVGYRVTDFVGLFSESGAHKVEVFFQRFAHARLMAAGFVRQITVDAADRIGEAFTSNTTRSAVAITSGAVAATILASTFMPFTFSSVLMGMPVAVASTVSGIALGGTMALTPIGGAALIATLFVLVTGLFNRRGTVEAPAERVAVEVMPDGSIVAEAEGKQVVIPREATAEGMETARKAAEAEWKGDIGSKARKGPHKR